MMSYEHLNQCDRKVIKNLLSKNKSFREIARYIGRDPSTISREIKKNKGKYWYHPIQAHEKYTNRRKTVKVRKLESNTELKDHVVKALKAGNSPDAISGRLKLIHRNSPGMQISHESIYTWIYLKAAMGVDLYKYLPRGVKKRHRRLNKRRSRIQIPDKISIHTRPKAVENRRQTGHWEGDTITGKGHQGYIATLVERKTRFLAAGLMTDKQSTTCNRAIFEAFGNIPNKSIKTITFDNGKEFYHHKDLQEALECKTFFADPYSAWQRGSNEHANGLLRRYFPKKLSFRELTQNDVDIVVNKLNNIPRKSLGYRTPYEVFHKLSVALHT
jgi:transposase, IS30 family